MLTTRVKWQIAAAVTALLVLSIFAGSWLGAREDQIRMKATIDAQQQVIDASQKQAKQIQAAEAERDKQTAATVASLQAAAARQVTPAQIAAWIPKQIPVPQPITFTVPAATPQNPSPDATASIPVADLPVLRDQIEKCQECSAKLSTAQADLTSRDQRLSLAGQQLSAMTRERDAAVQASKGGAFWSRAKRTAKYVAIGGAIAGASICGTGHCK